MFRISKWVLLLIGMGMLIAGLAVHVVSAVRSENPDLFVPSVLYAAGALVLIVPPLLERLEARTEEERRFATLLVTLEVFLVISGLLSFWHNLELKIPVRIAASLLVTAFIKYGLGELKDFRWSFVVNPWRLAKYHFYCLRGTYREPAYSMALGIDWLGIGYAFVEYPFGQIALLIGSGYLFLSAWRGYRATGKPISLAWTLLNGVYVAVSIVLVVLALTR